MKKIFNLAQILLLSVLLFTLSSCEGQRIKNEISDINAELPLKVDDDLRLTNIEFPSDDSKVVKFYLSVPPEYRDVYSPIMKNLNKDQKNDLRYNIVSALSEYKEISDLYKLMTERHYTSVYYIFYDSSNFVII